MSLNKSANTTKSTARDVGVYLSRAGGTDSDIMKLLNTTELERFIQIMNDPEDLDFQPSTCKEKLYRLKLAIKFAKRTIDNEQLYYKANRVIDCIEEWCHGLSQDISLQRREHCLVVREQLPHVQDSNEFLKDKEVYIYVDSPCGYYIVIHTGKG